MFFMQADHHLRITIAEIVDETVMQAAIARAWCQGDVAQIKTAQHLSHGVRGPAQLRIGLLDQLVLVIEAGAGELAIALFLLGL